jgi:hypothetical protein
MTTSIIMISILACISVPSVLAIVAAKILRKEMQAQKDMLNVI